MNNVGNARYIPAIENLDVPRPGIFRGLNFFKLNRLRPGKLCPAVTNPNLQLNAWRILKE